MAIKQLTEEQVRTMSLEEKDRWWLENVYRGNMPQLTVRSALTGMLLGGALSLTNLYIGAQTGWTLGVGITSVVLAYAIFRVLSQIGLGSEMTVLENNAMQSIATSAGYMTAPLVSSLAAYTMVTGKIIPMWVAIAWVIILAVLGVLFAFPMKKRFINDEQLPFPEGMAAGVVMDSLHTGSAKEGMLKAKLLVGGGLASALVEVLRSETVMRLVAATKSIPHYYDDLLYDRGIVPKLLGTPLKSLTIRFETGIVFLATGGLMGIRAGVSLMVGGVLNYFILAPYLIQKGIILPKKVGAAITFNDIALWALWGGVACMTTASLYAFFAKPQIIISAFTRLFKKGEAKADVLEHIELPLRWSIIGVPVVGAIMVVCGWLWFDIKPWLSALAIPLVFVFSLIAVNSTALTAITPGGALAKLTQLTYAVLAPKNISTNLMTAGITSEVALNASNLLMDIKPGYMLGAKPRQQMVGHLLGAFAGSLVATPVWYYGFIQGDPSRYGSDKIPVPGAMTWKAVSEILMKGFDFLHPTAKYAVVVGAVVGILMELSKQLTKGRFPLSGVAVGLAFVLRFETAFAMFLGSFLFWMLGRAAHRAGAHDPHALPSSPAPSSAAVSSGDADEAEAAKSETSEPSEPSEPAKHEAPKHEEPKHEENDEGPKPWYVVAYENMEPLCGGVIAGGSLIGVAVMLIELNFKVDPVKPAVVKTVGAITKAMLGAP